LTSSHLVHKVRLLILGILLIAYYSLVNHIRHRAWYSLFNWSKVFVVLCHCAINYSVFHLRPSRYWYRIIIVQLLWLYFSYVFVILCCLHSILRYVLYNYLSTQAIMHWLERVHLSFRLWLTSYFNVISSLVDWRLHCSHVTL
jgi:uncharacterized membrane protein